MVRNISLMFSTAELTMWTVAVDTIKDIYEPGYLNKYHNKLKTGDIVFVTDGLITKERVVTACSPDLVIATRSIN